MKKGLFILFFLAMSLHGLAQICGTPGLDGSANISGSINTYFPIAGDVTLSSGAKSLQLAAVPSADPYGNNFGSKAISAGDMLLLIQMQDATINSSNDNRYGGNLPGSGPDDLGGTGLTDLGNTGIFEYVIATNAVGLTGGNLTFKGAGPNKGTVNTYINAAETSGRGKRTFQVVRIPQFSNLSLSSSISTPPFNGKAGGIIAFEVSGTMNFNGFTIDASARGFRGGWGPVSASLGNVTDVYVVTSSSTQSVGKGEGIAGTPRFMWDGFNPVDNLTEGLPGGSYGKGAPANGGGGGNDHNAGGGGGGNGGYGGVGGNGTASVTSFPNTFPNGGRPGSVSFSGSGPDITRIIMGGGGGGGDANNALSGVKGGVGGGIVLINVGRIIGNGVILANGGEGAAGAQGNQPDGAGGGGAGGSVFIKVTDPHPLAVLTIEAKGGNGGNTRNDTGTNEHGPGGGGGGGQVFYAMSAGTVNVAINAGLSGKTNSGAGTSHGASDGTNGESLAYAISSLPLHLQGGGSGCYPSLTTTVQALNPAGAKVPGMEIEYEIRAKNYLAGGNAGGVQIEMQLPAGISFQSASVSYTGDAGGPGTVSNLGTNTRPLLGDFNISPGDEVIITLKAIIECGTGLQLYHASAQTLYLDPSRTIADPNRRITSLLNAFSGSKTTYETGSSGNVPGSNFNGNSSSADNVTVTAAIPLSNNAISSASSAQFCISSAGELSNPPIITGSTPAGGTGVYSYEWQVSTDNITFSDLSAFSKDFDPLPIAVTSYYRRIVKSTCSTPLVSNVFKIQVSVKPQVGFDMPDFCLNDGVATFTNKSTIPDGTESHFTYLWNFGDPGSGAANSSANKNGAHSYTLQGTYTVTLTVTSKDGCSAQKTQTFRVNGSTPKAEFKVSNPGTLCSGNPVVFQDLATVNFGEITKIEWYFDYANHPGQMIEDSDPGLRTSPKIYYHTYPTVNAPATVYKVLMKAYSGGSCIDEYELDITVYTMPEVEFLALPSVCLNNPAFQIIQATEKHGVPGNGVFSGNGVNSTGLFNPFIAGSGTHTITYTFTSASGACVQSKSQNIVVSPSPVLSNAKLDILLGGEIRFPPIADAAGLVYQWAPAAGLSATNILNPVAFPEETTIYTLTAADPLTGCSTTGTITVTVNKVPEIPNTFTPNGDGINDFWTIENLNTYGNCTVTVFNRYGVEVYRSLGYSSPWNGTHNGNPLPAGTYYYVIDPKKGRKVITGSITILR